MSNYPPGITTADIDEHFGSEPEEEVYIHSEEHDFDIWRDQQNDVTSVSADGKQVVRSEIKSELNGMPSGDFKIDDGYMNQYDPILEGWIMVKMPEPISRMAGQQVNRDKR